MRARDPISRLFRRFSVLRAHGSVPGVHVVSKFRLPRGRALVALLLFVRMFSFSIGCGPRDGTVGGKCTTHTDDCTGHTTDQYCEDGICDPATDICKAAPPQAPESPPPPHCEGSDRGACPANQVLFSCFEDASPDALDCNLTIESSPGNAGYCCTPPASSCFSQDSPCSDPSQFFACAYEDSPAIVMNDASLRCALLSPYPGSGYDYCCASGDACFSIPNEDWCGTKTPYFCPGTTSPDASGCTRMDIPDPPATNDLEGYCCDTPPPALDAGED